MKVKKVLLASVLAVVLAITGVILPAETLAKPTVRNLSITPASPKDTDNLTASWDYSDGTQALLTGDSELKWLKRGVGQAGYAEQSAYTDQNPLPAAATANGESWYFSIKACNTATPVECSDVVPSVAVTIRAAVGPGTGTGGPGGEGIPTGVCPRTMKHKITGCDPTPCPKGAECVEVEACCLLDMIYTVADWIFVILLVVSAIFIIWGGIEFVTSGGVPDKVTSGRNKLIWALVGVVIAFVARGLVLLITQIIR